MLKIKILVYNETLFATGPLFASAAKSNYTTPMAHFLVAIASYPRLKERMNYYCNAFKIPRNINGILIMFDEGLESFGVRFIKAM